jgi:hypothetical protein
MSCCLLLQAAGTVYSRLTPRASDCAAQPGKCNVIMNCVEKGRLHLSGGSYIQGNEGVPPSSCATGARCSVAHLHAELPALRLLHVASAQNARCRALLM